MGTALSSVTKRIKRRRDDHNRTSGDGDETGRVHVVSAGEDRIKCSSAGMAPTANSKVDRLIAEHKVVVFSKSYCPYCDQAKELFRGIGVDFFALELDHDENGVDIQKALLQKTGQRTVPAVFINGTHVGGYDETSAANSSGRLKQLLDGDENDLPKFDYDLIVIGGGSGGLAASKETAKLGRKVAVFDYVVPSPIGTTWGLGGTCVNVGCIPKKLMHHAAILGHNIEDSRKFGWEVAEDVKHNWETMTTNVQNHIGSLNWGYRVQLREKKVNYINAYAKFIGPHTVEATDRRGKKQVLTAEKFILATGLRPKYPGIPGDKEFGITSDDLFSLSYPPGKTCVIGASYVALECAGFLRAVGFEVTVLVRSILLRGFDQDMAERIGKYMEAEGIQIFREVKPIKVERLEEGQPGLLRLTSQKSDGEIFQEEYNTILFAIGRDACTMEIGLDTIGVKLNPKNNKVITINEQTNIPYVFAIGDLLDGKPELTPVAIQAGKLLSKRLFAGSTHQCDYINIPTTVFTPIEYGCIGYSEEDAISLYGEDNIEVYHTGMWPLEYTVAKRSESDCYLKLICVKPENEKVVGFHYLGPNAGEVTQGFGLGLKMGATKAHFDDLIGIHPTCAEGFTTMEITKRSGTSVKASGC